MSNPNIREADMTTVETIVLVILGIITLPYICKKIRREALLYSSYLLLGLGVGEFLQPQTHFMLNELGKVGFIFFTFFKFITKLANDLHYFLFKLRQ